MAEHAIALLMALNRKVHRASARTKDANFSLDGLVGFDLHGKTVTVVGCGKVRCQWAGSAWCRVNQSNTGNMILEKWGAFKCVG